MHKLYKRRKGGTRHSRKHSHDSDEDVSTLSPRKMDMSSPTLKDYIENKSPDDVFFELSPIIVYRFQELVRRPSTSLDRHNFIKEFEHYFIYNFHVPSTEEDTDVSIETTTRYWMNYVILTRYIVNKIISHYFPSYRKLGILNAYWSLDEILLSDQFDCPTNLDTKIISSNYDIDYGYLQYTGHILSFIINNITRTIEIYETVFTKAGDVWSEKYNRGILKLIHCYLPYTTGYTLEVFNTSAINLQDISKEYWDGYCLMWSTMLIYRRLIQGLTMEEMRKIYMFDRESDLPGRGGLGIYTNVETFYKNFIIDIKKFILATINQYYSIKYPGVDIIRNPKIFKEKYALLLSPINYPINYSDQKNKWKYKYEYYDMNERNLADTLNDNLEDFNTYRQLDPELQKDYVLNDMLKKYPNKNDYLRHISKKIAYYGGRRLRKSHKRRQIN